MGQQAILFDHINKRVVRFGGDPRSDAKLAEILTSLKSIATTASGTPPPR